MLLIQLLAGLALITFGVRFLRKGFDRLLGGRVAAGVEKAAKTPLRAMCAGVAAGAVAPSSTGLAVLISHLMTLGRVRTDRMLALLLGANIGLTLLANLVAFSMSSLTGIFLFLGVLGFQLCKAEKIRGVGQCLLAFGFVFLAMQFLRETALGISANADMLVLFHALERFPWILCAVAALLGVLLQSSTAMVGFGMSLAQGGVLPSSLFLVWIVGANLGLGITSLMVAWPHLEGRRLGYANLIAKLMIAFPLLLFAPTAELFREGSMIPFANQLALSHTAFNLAAGLAALPLLQPLLSLASRWLVPEHSVNSADDPARRSYLDPSALHHPSLALIQATREVQRMTDEVKSMLRDFWSARARRDTAAVRSVIRRDDEVDDLNRQLTVYLSQMGVKLTEQENIWRFMLLKISTELEAVGDVIERHLTRITIRQIQSHALLGENEEAALAMLYERTLRQLDRVLTLMTTRDGATASEILRVKQEVVVWCAVERQTVEQTLKPDAESVETAICYLDAMEGLRQINKHLAKAADCINERDFKVPAIALSPKLKRTGIQQVKAEGRL